MAKLTTKARNALPSSDFGIPSERRFPEEDAAHARNAKARASQGYEHGYITKSEMTRIDNKADRKLGKTRGR